MYAQNFWRSVSSFHEMIRRNNTTVGIEKKHNFCKTIYSYFALNGGYPGFALKGDAFARHDSTIKVYYICLKSYSTKGVWTKFCRYCPLQVF